MALQTPFLDGQPLFQIGLEALNLSDWLEIDDELGFYLREKRMLHDTRPEQVFCHEPESIEVQQLVYEMIFDHLKANHLDTHMFDQDGVVVAGDRIVLPPNAPPLKTAALLVQEDLLLLQRKGAGWFLTAGSLCFPSSWSLEEKFGKRLDVIHDEVPGFGTGTRKANLMARIFDNLPVEKPVRRANWSIYPDYRLFHPDSTIRLQALNEDGSNAIFRIEHQTLRKLPGHDAILFTVRIKRKPLVELVGEKALVERIASSLDALDEPQLDYKGLREKHAMLKQQLKRIAEMSGAQ